MNPFMQNIKKMTKHTFKSCWVHTANFLKYVWPFFNIMHQRLKTEANLGPCQTSMMMKCLAKIVNGKNMLTIFGKSFSINV